MYKINIDKIQKAILEKLNKTETEIAKNVVSEVVDVINPIAGVSVATFNTFLSNFDECKINHLLYGLSRGLDMEKQINELYNYVCSSSARAFIVGNIFKETLAAESLKVCVILGYIISKHLDNKSDFTRDELIVCKALENANDYDLENFEILMKNCVREEKDGRKKIIYDIDDPEVISGYELTCEWCVYNRMFTEEVTEWEEITDESPNILDLSTHYYIKKTTDILVDLINDVKQIWDY